MSSSQSYTLRGQIRALETTTQVTLAVLALASGVFTYLGVRELLDGSATTVFFGAVIYSTSVSVAIYAFWSYLLRFMPHVRQPGSRRLLYVAMAMGACFIMAMSSWLNAAALAGSAALEQHLANTTEDYQQKFNAAHENALASQSLLPDLQLASQRFSGLADVERRSGALTGTSGSGTVVQLLSQMSAQLGSLQAEVEGSRTAIDTIFGDGGKRLSTMRELVSSGGPIAERSNAYAEEAVQLSGLITALQQTSVAPAVKRAAADLGQTFIAPVADGTDAELQNRQSEVVGRVEAAVKAQSVALAAAADEILARPVVEPLRFTPISAPEAVIRYARDFLPSWAGAIAIDLIPGVLIFILCIVQEVIRREDGEEMGEAEMSTADLMRALRIREKLRVAEAGTRDAQDEESGEIVVGAAGTGAEIVQRNDPVAPFPKTALR
ncbi:hypothetical protein ASG43_06700 [Aureimonas sp. Leaf454]|uniref:hypothetical protein n=1 Tax=Aureimonas sp. Leaf454 TaxID=1736381 RepID=UPI0006FC7A5A|nr:hypothetical protein [Aureimonas sp. Leaf454]KQT50932.1 hypothetical protein ASG43_06700 [Aureimonas sp. Leaf454]